jgi:carboxyl-terminal processing protease
MVRLGTGKGKRLMQRFVTLGVLLIAAICLPFLWFSGPAQTANSETYRQLNLFGDVFERVRASYVEEVKDSQLIEYAINGMLNSLDPHSSYLNAENYRDMTVQTRGEFGGLGIEVTMEEGIVKVVAPIDDTPAARAGLLANDYITHIDGEPVLGMTLSEAVKKMRGPVNTSIKLSIFRQGGEKPFEVVIVRDIITIKSVKYERDGDIGYIRVTTFNEKTDELLRAAVAGLNKHPKKPAGYIIDLRNNPGGLLDQAIAVSDAFLTKGEIVSTRGRNAEDIQRYNARGGDILEGKPIIVLINGGSASASEIVAGALQDHHRATVLGTRSFGKGSVQTIIPLGREGAIRLTTARYYTPAGTSIQAKGIKPDIRVEQVDPKAKEKEKRVLPFDIRSEADLRGHLTAEGDEEKERDASPAIIPEKKQDDRQYQRAVELLKGVGQNVQLQRKTGTN